MVAKILQDVLKAKMEFANERDKKGRLAYTWNQEESAEIIAEIVQESQKAVVGACTGCRHSSAACRPARQNGRQLQRDASRSHAAS